MLFGILFLWGAHAITTCGPEQNVFSVEQALPTSITTLHIFHDGMTAVSFFADNTVPDNIASVTMDVEASSAAAMTRFKHDDKFTLAANVASLSVKISSASTVTSGTTFNSPPFGLFVGASMVGLLGSQRPWLETAVMGACLMAPHLVMAETDCISADIVVMVPPSILQVCEGTSVGNMRCVARSTLAAPQRLFFPNPRDMTLYQEGNNESTTTFYGGKDINGLPTLVYQMSTHVGEPAGLIPAALSDATTTFNSTVNTLFDVLPSPSDPAVRFSVVRRMVSDFVDFSFHYDVDNKDPNATTQSGLPSSFYLSVRSADSLFAFNTPSQSLSGVSLATVGQLPPRPATVIMYDRSEEVSSFAPMDTIGVKINGQDYAPITGALLNFVVEVQDPLTFEVVDRKKIAGVELVGGLYAARFPLFRAPTNNSQWLAQFRRETTKHVNTQCALISAMEPFLEQACDDVSDALLVLLNQSSNNSSNSSSQVEADDADRTVEACRSGILAWKLSCSSSSPRRALLASDRPIGVANFDSFTALPMQIIPEMNILGAGPAGTQLGTPFDIPEGTSRDYPFYPTSMQVSKVQPRCAALSVAGGDTPDTRSFDFGTSKGSFSFYYQTYTQQDQIDVFHGSTLLFSTGCVGATSTVELTLSNSASNSITVAVTPNCFGGSGTAWDYVVSCLGAKAQLECDFNGQCQCKAYNQQNYIPRQVTPPTSNGCGAAGGAASVINPVISWYVNDRWQAEFWTVCNAHDICYGTCGSVRSTCDQNMCSGHRAVCATMKTALDAQNNDPKKCPSMSREPYLACDFYADCMSQANTICWAVSGQYGGQSPFEAAQKELCVCDT